MRLEWDENKNKSNIQKHGIDFGDSANIFGNTMVISWINDLTMAKVDG